MPRFQDAMIEGLPRSLNLRDLGSHSIMASKTTTGCISQGSSQGSNNRLLQSLTYRTHTPQRANDGKRTTCTNNEGTLCHTLCDVKLTFHEIGTL